MSEEQMMEKPRSQISPEYCTGEMPSYRIQWLMTELTDMLYN